ncbi:MAG: ATP-dependent Clp protease ATP-binding subunit ClpC [Actinomycetota bacterium]|jgi:ATP-dependent Clp protease ATP-binding subunit ClpA
MFERFTEEARQVLVCANDVAREQKSPHIRRHHMLIALIDGADSSELVTEVFDSANVDRPALRTKLLESLLASEEADLETGKKPFSGGGKKALELSLREALSLGHNYIASPHILLAILRAADGPLEDVLGSTELDYDKARAIVRTRAPERRRGGGRGRRVRMGRSGLGRGTTTRGLERVLAAAFRRAGTDRQATTGDLLVALAETPGTHFASIIAEASLPSADAISSAADRLISDAVEDGEPDRVVRFDADNRTVSFDDASLVEALRRVVEGAGGTDKLKEALRRLQADDDDEA